MIAPISKAMGRPSKARLSAAALGGLAACAGGLPDEAPNPAARPATMLSGVLCGDAVLTGPGYLGKSSGDVKDEMIVTSRGEARGDALVLDQTIRFADGETATRRWVVRPDGPDSYVGTLTGDEAVAASGAVRARVAGDTLRIRYPVAGVPLARMEQFLTLREDGAIANRGTVRVLGVPVRHLEETITPVSATDARRPCETEPKEAPP